ncbi:hypothetical protein HDG35_007401 [Paraburkholderia sp. JPY681]|nr:hypothetical protein [Paraburkholderia atlantica]
MSRLEILVNEPTPVELLKRPGNADGEAQNTFHPERRAHQSLKWFAARILENQCHPFIFAYQLYRVHRPRTIQLFFQREFVSKALEKGDRWMFLGGPESQDAIAAARGPDATESALCILPKDVDTETCVRAMWIVHLPSFTATR